MLASSKAAAIPRFALALDVNTSTLRKIACMKTYRTASLSVQLLAVIAMLACGTAQAALETNNIFKVRVTSANDPTKPVPGGVRWFWRNHGENMQKTKANNFDLCFLGDSITQGWPGELLHERFGKYRVANFGIGGDRCENVLWRLENGELANTSVKVIVLLLGTNNSGMNTPEEMALGVATVLSCTIFAAISGSSVATALSIGSSAIPQMKRFGYPERNALGVRSSPRRRRALPPLASRRRGSTTWRTTSGWWGPRSSTTTRTSGSSTARCSRI